MASFEKISAPKRNVRAVPPKAKLFFTNVKGAYGGIYKRIYRRKEGGGRRKRGNGLWFGTTHKEKQQQEKKTKKDLLLVDVRVSRAWLEWWWCR